MKVLLLFSIFCISVSCLLVVAGQRDRARSISQHAANSELYTLYVILCSLGLFSFYIFMRRYFIPTFSLPISFHILMLAGLTSDFIGLFIKENDGTRGRIHRIFAYTMAASLPLSLIMILLLAPLGPLCRTIIVAALAGIIAGAVSLVLRWQHVWRNYLCYQSLYILLFFVAILAATFIPDL